MEKTENAAAVHEPAHPKDEACEGKGKHHPEYEPAREGINYVRRMGMLHEQPEQKHEQDCGNTR